MFLSNCGFCSNCWHISTRVAVRLGASEMDKGRHECRPGKLRACATPGLAVG